MKKIVLAFSFITLLGAACSKNNEDFSLPALKNESSLPVNYADTSIGIADFKVTKETDGTIVVHFSTLYTQEIASIEIMKGETTNYLCTFYSIHHLANSSSKTNYTVIDATHKTQEVYYMLRYLLNNGNWGYTPIFKLQ
jgi:hypothetical protein